jgi:hypothetical protein
MRNTDLCASWLGGWAVVIDVLCRLSEFTSYLEEISALGEVFVFRVADGPVEVHYNRGKKVWKHEGLEAVLRALGRSKPKSGEYVDGETISWELMRQRTGLDFTKDFWKVQYRVFVVPGPR